MLCFYNIKSKIKYFTCTLCSFFAMKFYALLSTSHLFATQCFRVPEAVLCRSRGCRINVDMHC